MSPISFQFCGNPELVKIGGAKFIKYRRETKYWPPSLSSLHTYERKSTEAKLKAQDAFKKA